MKRLMLAGLAAGFLAGCGEKKTPEQEAVEAVRNAKPGTIAYAYSRENDKVLIANRGVDFVTVGTPLLVIDNPDPRDPSGFKIRVRVVSGPKEGVVGTVPEGLLRVTP